MSSLYLHFVTLHSNVHTQFQQILYHPGHVLAPLLPDKLNTGYQLSLGTMTEF